MRMSGAEGDTSDANSLQGCLIPAKIKEPACFVVFETQDGPLLRVGTLSKVKRSRGSE